MANEIALAVHCRPGEAVLCDATSHIIGFEGGGPAALAGVMIEPLQGTRGIFHSGELLRFVLGMVLADLYAHGGFLLLLLPMRQ